MAALTPRLQQWRATFGDNLRRLREQRGFSQELLAERAGVDRKLIYRTELGQTSPRLDAVVQIATALGIAVRDLMPADPLR
ncbi:MAG TPA: helix-turn-helix transcriptional regulator [Jatrophihabitans sp.]